MRVSRLSRLIVVAALLSAGVGVTGSSSSPAHATTTTLCESTAYGCTTGGYSGTDPWGYSNYSCIRASNNTKHNCTSYAAFKLAKNGVSNPGRLGNASAWDDNARRYDITVNNTPAVGTIAQWDRNHVAYVEAVGPDYIITTEDNCSFVQNGIEHGLVTRRKKITTGSGWPDNFIHFKDASLKASSSPTVSGTPSVGAKLSASSGTWVSSTGGTPTSKVTYKYQWLANSSTISGATSSTYTPSVSVAGKKISVKVTASARGYKSTSKTSSQTAAVVLAFGGKARDFDGDGFDDVYWYAPGATEDRIWSGTATRGTFASVLSSVSGTYRPIGGDFDGDGFNDVYWYAPGSALDTIFFGTATQGTFDRVERSVSGTYVPVTGDFDGDGFDDVYWYAPGSGTDTIWFGSATRGTFASVERSVSGTYVPVTGDFDGDGFDDVYWYAPGSGTDTIWFGSATRGTFASVERSVSGTYVPVTGDFDGDGFDDVYWYAPGSGTDTIWFGTATRGTFASVRRSVSGSYRPVTGDFDGDGFDDVYWYAPGSGTDTIWFGTATRAEFASVRRSVSGTYVPLR